MKYILYLIPFVAVLAFSGCNNSDDEMPDNPTNGALALNFKGVFGGEPLVMFTRNYEYEDGMKLQPQLFQFYISDVKLIRQTAEGTEKVDVFDIALPSFGDIQSEPAALAGITTDAVSLPAGEYSGVEFGFGVSPELNATIPPDYQIGHPLSENYWEASGSYIFFKFESNADLEPNGDFADKLTFHVGGDENYRELSFSKNFTIEPGQQQQLNFELDLQKILVDENGEYLDFRTVKQSHSNSSPAATFMSNNVTRALSLK